MNISNLWLDIINIALTTILVFLSLVDSITKKSFEQKHIFFQNGLAFFKKLNIKIIVISFVTLGLFFVTREKYNNTNFDKNVSDSIAKAEFDRRDSINHVKFQEDLITSSSASSNATAETMAKYYLKYDSTQHNIEKIVKDSSYNRNLKPEVDICSVDGNFINDTISLKLNLCASVAAAYNVVIIENYIVRFPSNGFNNDKLELIKKDRNLFRNALTPNGISKEINREFVNTMFYKEKPIFYVYITGSYQDVLGKKYTIENLTLYNSITKLNGDLSIKEYDWIYNFLMKKK